VSLLAGYFPLLEVAAFERRMLRARLRLESVEVKQRVPAN
jgi:hypothetical protein